MPKHLQVQDSAKHTSPAFKVTPGVSQGFNVTRKVPGNEAGATVDPFQSMTLSELACDRQIEELDARTRTSPGSTVTIWCTPVYRGPAGTLTCTCALLGPFTDYFPVKWINFYFHRGSRIGFEIVLHEKRRVEEGNS